MRPRNSSVGLIGRGAANDIPILIQDGNSVMNGRSINGGRWRIHHLGNEGDPELRLTSLRAIGAIRELGPLEVRNYVLGEKVAKLRSETRAHYLFLQILIIFLVVMGL